MPDDEYEGLTGIRKLDEVVAVSQPDAQACDQGAANRCGKGDKGPIFPG